VGLSSEQPLSSYLKNDHARLERLLERAFGDPPQVDQEAYAQFRSGLLRHIMLEERILLPEVTHLSGGRPPAIAERIRLDHGALSALMVPPPTRSILQTLRSILRVHNALEEGEGGLYQICDHTAGEKAPSILMRMTSAGDVPLRPFNKKPEALQAARRALARAGYQLIE
jgi:hypothetical protein